jgi:hypothetical protein
VDPGCIADRLAVRPADSLEPLGKVVEIGLRNGQFKGFHVLGCVLGVGCS